MLSKKEGRCWLRCVFLATPKVRKQWHSTLFVISPIIRSLRITHSTAQQYAHFRSCSASSFASYSSSLSYYIQSIDTAELAQQISSTPESEWGRGEEGTLDIFNFQTGEFLTNFDNTTLTPFKT